MLFQFKCSILKYSDTFINSANTWHGKEEPNYIDAINRSKITNSIINSSTIEATIHLDKISQVFK